MATEFAHNRDVVFISKATPGDNEFALWLAPNLEAAGYSVFVDIRSLEGGDRWRRELTTALQDRAVKMLLCCRDSTLEKEGVQEEIGIALDLVKDLKDPRFIIPLRLEPYKKLFGIGELQYVDFVRGWAQGLEKLLQLLRKQKVPSTSDPQISPIWEIYRRRGAISVLNEPERLTSNWLQVREMPTEINYFEATGANDRLAMSAACEAAQYPIKPHLNGFFSFASEEEVNQCFKAVGRFSKVEFLDVSAFRQFGSVRANITGQAASNLIQSMFRAAWDNLCRKSGLLEYHYSTGSSFHISGHLARLGERISWGNQADRRSSALRNVAKGYAWEFGVTGLPSFWPFPHIKLKSRVLFSSLTNGEYGEVVGDSRKQHRLRRTVDVSP